MKKLHIFMLRQFLLLFAGTFFICLFVLMMQFLWRYVDDLIGKGLSLDVLAQFFGYMALMLVPQALPLAILLASLITMGNLGESSELTAIKAAGISLLRCLRPLMVCACFIAAGSFVFQNNIGPQANFQLRQLLMAMRQKSPELEIPEEIFYSGIPGCNIYVQRKNPDTGMLYGVMIYRMTQSFEDAAIILADSGMLQSTAEKRHLRLTLHGGEWFENLQQQAMGGASGVPYRRESFTTKVIVLDFDNGLDMDAGAMMRADASAQSLEQLALSRDSVRRAADTLGMEVQRDMRLTVFTTPQITKRDSLAALRRKVNVDTLFRHLTPEQQRDVLQAAANRANMAEMNLDFRHYVAENQQAMIRCYDIETVNKFTLSLTCVIFFFIGASLGAIIRKGGLGIPVIISVLVYILFFILDNTGFRMARQGSWSVAFGKGLSPAVLIPLAAFVTYKANKDAVIISTDTLRRFFMRLLGMRFHRTVAMKDVVITDPDYPSCLQRLATLNDDIHTYAHQHHLRHLPSPVKVFFRYQPDHEIERIADELELIVDNLANARDRRIIGLLNRYPIMSRKAHTRPFERKWLNIAAAIVLPLGIILYIRMCRFRLRLYRDLWQTTNTNNDICDRIRNITEKNEKNEQNLSCIK